MKIYKDIFKPLLDFMISLILSMILFPVFIIIFVLLSISNNGSPFFYQNRPGRNGEVFKIVKFKTMNDKRDNNGDLFPENERITIVGSFLRNSSLDEIPQLFNVIKGDMSLVGPRPLLCKYLPLYNDKQKRRHDVKPGITGFAQVNGRNALSWDEKFKFDIDYVENLTLSLDIKILWKTILKAIRREGVGVVGNTVGTNIYDEFTGDSL